jgi:type VI protein secretion system component Hcp
MVIVSNVSWSHADPSPTEDITFDYGALQITYTQQTITGGMGQKFGPTAWSRVKNNDEFKV